MQPEQLWRLELSIEGLGGDLAVRRFDVSESLSDGYKIAIWFLSERHDLDIGSALGFDASFAIFDYIAGGTSVNRKWTGICARMEQIRPEPLGLSRYYIEIVPHLWRARHRRNHRIFQHISIPNIVRTLLAEWQVTANWCIDENVVSYPEFEFRVQYGESDYDFIKRLLEEAGITFFYDFEEEQRQLVMTDQPHNGPDRKGGPVPWVDNPMDAPEREYISALSMANAFRPGGYHIRDYNFRNPAALPQADAAGSWGPEQPCEQYHYRPGVFTVEPAPGGATPFADDKGVARVNDGYGQAVAERELSAERAYNDKVQFDTNCIDLSPGKILTVENHPHPSMAPPMLMSGLRLRGTWDTADEWTIDGAAVFADHPYHPPRQTQRPRIYGLQTAKVVGPAADEIHTDEFGRVRVQFHWDREGQSDAFSSCWMHVSQGWGGGGYGLITIPRVGHEVMVAFLEGDPDRPMVVGRVFNGINTVPYPLPQHKTKSAFRTKSTPQSEGYNELVFEDAAGMEQVYMHAERDWDKLIENDERHRTRANHWQSIEGDCDVVVNGTTKRRVDGDDHTHVVGKRLTLVDDSEHRIIKNSRHESVAVKHALDVGQEIHMLAGQKVVVESANSITLKCPGGFIEMGPAGIAIVGKVVLINSGGAATPGSGAQPEPAEDAADAVIVDPMSLVGSPG